MAYDFFDKDKPDPSVDNGTNAATNIKKNQQALRDCIIVGTFFNWSMTPRNSIDTGPPTDPTKPPLIKYVNGDEIIKSVLTWNASGSVTKVVYSYSSDSGQTYTTIKTKNITYDTNGNVTGTTWS